jgi:hypothetical protein
VLRQYSWQVFLGVILLLLSLLLYAVSYVIFRSPSEILVWFLGSLAFLPISVLFVTIIITEMLNYQERRSRLEKLNMVIGAFFSEVGTSFLAYCSDCDPNLDQIRSELLVSNDWTEGQFDRVSAGLSRYPYGVDVAKVDLEYLRAFTGGKRAFLLRLMENPNLLEHESFTDMLRAVFHLTEELLVRPDLTDLPRPDLLHLQADISRAYVGTVREWVAYMRYLKENYPYLFSLAVRVNPFDQEASVVISQ